MDIMNTTLNTQPFRFRALETLKDSTSIAGLSIYQALLKDEGYDEILQSYYENPDAMNNILGFDLREYIMNT
jgi:hypothetical protein